MAAARAAEPADSEAVEGVPLPEPDAIRDLVRDPVHARVRGHMQRLAESPDAIPQVILLEGGSTTERLAMALYWTALLHCRGPEPSRAPAQVSMLGAMVPDSEAVQDSDERPCLACTRCMQALTGANRDLFLLDGRVDFIKIDPVREMRRVLGEPPRDHPVRVVILAEAQNLTVPAANALLKSLEEPRPGNSFVLLAPQRERLLPTLVSRSFVLTLAWPRGVSDPDGNIPALREEATEDAASMLRFAEGFAMFLESGKGWFALTGAKGAVNKNIGLGFCNKLERAILAVLTGKVGDDRLAGALANRLDPAALRALDIAVDQATQALDKLVNPALTLDWLATTAVSLARDATLRRHRA
ncbi:DNA polymerase III subunit delta' [Oceanidesulfovibrio indonesiensis]|uniref:DNA polymerase III subunit delta n=1 Tax=Oceanidesulfovibrio indonesiensis TaxID=54767 RepID=A0A7M3MFA8_9BACT|nr:DNA polymerase III subunit delta' [Oceanidesulfovibrio indonesiensis]TVM17612.1 DNA polymerase III subunit delta' [Oceanidesulfovibrio indonesiensis]